MNNKFKDAIYNSLKLKNFRWPILLATILIPFLVSIVVVLLIPKSRRLSADATALILVKTMNEGKFRDAESMFCSGKKTTDLTSRWPLFINELGGNVSVKNVRREKSIKDQGEWVVPVVLTIQGKRKVGFVQVGVSTRLSAEGACVNSVHINEK